MLTASAWCCRVPAAKKHHPDVNPGDATAEARFKRMTSAYTQALLVSARRERMSESDAASSSQSSGPRTRPRTAYATPRTTTGPVDPSRFNVREWDHAHYGLKGATAEERQSEYIRNLHRQARAQQSATSAYYARRAQARAAGGGGAGSPYSTAIIAASLAACASVWTAVYQTNLGRFRQAETAVSATPRKAISTAAKNVKKTSR